MKTVCECVRLAREANRMAVHWTVFETWDLAARWRDRRDSHMMEARRLKGARV